MSVAACLLLVEMLGIIIMNKLGIMPDTTSSCMALNVMQLLVVAGPAHQHDFFLPSCCPLCDKIQALVPQLDWGEMHTIGNNLTKLRAYLAWLEWQ